MAIMYTSIRFATLQLHHTTEDKVNTLSKTIPVYEKDFFVFSDEDDKTSSLEIKAVIFNNQPKDFLFYPDLLNHFQWHLN